MWQVLQVFPTERLKIADLNKQKQKNFFRVRHLACESSQLTAPDLIKCEDDFQET